MKAEDSFWGFVPYKYYIMSASDFNQSFQFPQPSQITHLMQSSRNMNTMTTVGFALTCEVEPNPNKVFGKAQSVFILNIYFAQKELLIIFQKKKVKLSVSHNCDSALIVV